MTKCVTLLYKTFCFLFYIANVQKYVKLCSSMFQCSVSELPPSHINCRQPLKSAIDASTCYSPCERPCLGCLPIICFILALRSSRREPSFGCDMSTDFEEADDDMKDFALQYANTIIQHSLNQVCLPAVGYLMCRTALSCFKIIISEH